MTNKHHTVLYTGVTNDLQRRVLEHREGKGGVFTKKYNVHKLVYFENGEDVNAAIFREKQIKAGSRQKKIDLINSINPEWKDLFETYFGNDDVTPAPPQVRVASRQAKQSPNDEEKVPEQGIASDEEQERPRNDIHP
jgi:putative endonuclease